MTDNKFWLVWSSNETPIRVTSLRDAELKALEWLKKNPYRKVFITQPIKCFEGDVKIIESDFITPESKTPTPELVVGEIKVTARPTLGLPKMKLYDADSERYKNFKHAKTETTTPEFKVGDKVKLRPIKYSLELFDGVIKDIALDFVFCEYECPSRGVILKQIHKDMAHEFLTHA
jgi:hypothetical protein